MECIVCHQKIKLGEQIFWGTQMEYCGPENDCSYTSDSEGLMGAVHLICLGSSTGATRTSNTEVSEPVEDGSKSVVERSDALSLLSGVKG